LSKDNCVSGKGERAWVRWEKKVGEQNSGQRSLGKKKGVVVSRG